MRNLGKHVVVPVILVTMALIVLSMSALGLVAFRFVNDEVVASLRTNANVVGVSTAGRLERGVRMGIPLSKQVGMKPFLEGIEQQSAAVSGFAVVDTAGTRHAVVGIGTEMLAATRRPGSGTAGSSTAEAEGLVQQAWRTAGQLLAVVNPDQAAVQRPELISHPLEGDGGRIGTLYVAVDQGHVLRELQATAIDIGVVMGVAVLLAFETLLLVISTNISGPLTQLFRILRRLADRDYTSKATVTGARVIRDTLAAANALVDRVDSRAVEVRNRLADRRNQTDDGRFGGARAKPTVEDRLARIGRFALGPRQHIGVANHSGARAAAFLFVLAEELLRPFLPLYIETVTQNAAGVALATVIAIPMSAFLLTTALAGPFVAAWSDRIGRRRSFLIGAGVSSVSLAGTAFAVGFADLVAWRALAGIGYATTFAACQGHVIDQTSEADRTRGLSVFVGGIFGANVCGPALGGILAVQVGYGATIFTAAGIALAAAGLAYYLMGDQSRAAPARGSSTTVFKAATACARNLRFTAILVLAAIPAKMMLTGFLFFTVPILLRDLGVTESSIGRLAMLYGIAALLLMPVFAQVCDRLRAHGAMVGAGALVSGIGLIPLLFNASLATVALAIVALGVGQAMSISAQTSLLTIVGRDEIGDYGPGPVLGAFRLTERLGSAAGPLVAALLSQQLGYVGTATAFGFGSVALGTLFSALFLSIGMEREDPETDTLDSVEAPA
jgi:predicted MFS family arabinose efflux permease